jgi:hypothetical protein
MRLNDLSAELEGLTAAKHKATGSNRNFIQGLIETKKAELTEAGCRHERYVSDVETMRTEFGTKVG